MKTKTSQTCFSSLCVFFLSSFLFFSLFVLFFFFVFFWENIVASFLVCLCDQFSFSNSIFLSDARMISISRDSSWTTWISSIQTTWGWRRKKLMAVGSCSNRTRSYITSLSRWSFHHRHLSQRYWGDFQYVHPPFHHPSPCIIRIENQLCCIELPF